MTADDTRPAAAAQPRRRTQAERTQQTQQKLVNGAIALLKEKRYAGFRVAEAAEVSGVSRGAQTHHFPNKDALVLQALEAVLVDTHRQALARIAEARADPRQLVRAIIEDSRAYFLGDDFYLALDLMMVGRDQPLGAEVRRLALQYRVSVEKAWLEVLIEADHPRREAEDVVLMTFSMARGLGIRKLMSGDTANFARLFGLWEQTARELLSGPRAEAGCAEPAAPAGRVRKAGTRSLA